MSKTVNVKVNAATAGGVQEHLWRYIGYDECNYSYTPEGKELLAKFGALKDAPYYVRTHFMFCTAIAMEPINSVPPTYTGRMKTAGRSMILPIMTGSWTPF